MKTSLLFALPKRLLIAFSVPAWTCSPSDPPWRLKPKTRIAILATEIHKPAESDSVSLERFATFQRMRALAWHGNVLYAARGYELLCAEITGDKIEWRSLATYRPSWWRSVTASSRLSFRMFRDGFHALAVLSSGHVVGAVAGAIVTLPPGESKFRISDRISRGTRPLHICANSKGGLFFGEYFDNPRRDEVNIYGSSDCGRSWSVC